MADMADKKYTVGLNSGTSMDGVDACIVEILESSDHTYKTPRVKLKHFLTHPYPPGLKERLRVVCREGRVDELCSYNVLLGRIFADAVKVVVATAGLTMEGIAVIGSHGQTVHHLPEERELFGYKISSTLQIGDPAVIAIECGVTTVGDFRIGDVAAGGQGAPLVPYLDQTFLQDHFEQTSRLGLLLNVGGISNFSAIVPERDLVFGFDCGPDPVRILSSFLEGNVLIDQLAKKWYNMEYDEDGKIGRSGSVCRELVTELIARDPFFKQDLPRSTGPEHFSQPYLMEVVALAEERGLSREDIMATITDFTAAAVWLAYERFIQPHFTALREQLAGSSREVTGLDLFVCGGGASNSFLTRCLDDRFQGFHVGTSQEIGVDPDAKEAVCFALLAHEALKHRSANLPSVTGSKKQVILGKICPVYGT